MSNASLPALRRSFQIIEYMCRQPQQVVTFSDLKRQIEGISSPALSRILQVLCTERILIRHENGGGYSLGPRIQEMVQMVFQHDLIPEIAKKVVERLAREFASSAACFLWDHDHIRLIAKFEVEEGIHLLPTGGANYRLTRNGFAQVCLAWLPEHQVEKLVQTCQEPPVLSHPEFMARLRRIRQDGYFYERGEARPSLHRLAAPLFTGNGLVLGIGIVFPAHDPGAPQDFINRFCRLLCELHSEYRQWLDIPEAIKSKGSHQPKN